AWVAILDNYLHHRYSQLEEQVTVQPAELPAWLSQLEAYVPTATRQNPERRTSSLAAYLRFILAERTRNASYARPYYDSLMELQPYCVRAIDGMADLGGLSNLHRTTTAGPSANLEALSKFAAADDGFPESAAPLVAKLQPYQWP